MFFDFQLPMAALFPAYCLTKNAGTTLLQQIAKDVAPERMQVVSFHPGTLYGEGWKKAGVGRDTMPWDTGMCNKERLVLNYLHVVGCHYVFWEEKADWGW